MDVSSEDIPSREFLKFLADLSERVRVLEVKQENHVATDTEQHRMFLAYQERSEEAMDKMAEALATVNSKLDKQRSFVGGIIFATTAVWTVLVALAGFFKFKVN